MCLTLQEYSGGARKSTVPERPACEALRSVGSAQGFRSRLGAMLLAGERYELAQDEA